MAFTIEIEVDDDGGITVELEDSSDDDDSQASPAAPGAPAPAEPPEDDDEDAGQKVGSIQEALKVALDLYKNHAQIAGGQSDDDQMQAGFNAVRGGASGS